MLVLKFPGAGWGTSSKVGTYLKLRAKAHVCYSQFIAFVSSEF